MQQDPPTPTQQTPISRRLSTHSNKSYKSIDQFRFSTDPLQTESRRNSFPIRPAINILLILLTTIQVFIVVNSRIYLRGELVRMFLSIYVDQDPYPGLFVGKEFYLTLTNVTELQQHFQYMFDRVNIIEDDSFVDLFYKDAKFTLHTQYKQIQGNQRKQNIHPINIEQGIVEPFNMSNITDIQLYLLQVQSFELQITNLTMRENWDGFEEKYEHSIRYYFIDSIRLEIGFDFRISNAMIPRRSGGQGKRGGGIRGGRGEEMVQMAGCVDGGCYYHKTKQNDNDDDDYPQQYLYNIKIRIFYSFVLLLSLISLYLNYISIRRTLKFLYQQLTLNHQQLQQQHQQPDHYHHPLIGEQQQHLMQQNIEKWVKVNNMTLTDMKLEHYFDILEFDLIFSTLSNVLGIVTALYLLAGFQRERIAGVTCLFAWMTIFKFVRNYQKLVLMYQLIKLSFNKVIKFFVEFFPVFLSYTFLGMCLFPKVSFFCSMANTVTTLVGIMMGDSIQMITDAILQKNSTILGIVYMFSFVFLFMHAIHNTLTSLIKQFFILKKIQLVKHQKQKNQQQNYIYIDQLKIQAEQQKQALPLKLSPDLLRGLLRIKALNRTKDFHNQITSLFRELQYIRLTEKWIIEQDRMGAFPAVKEQLIRRSMLIGQFLDNLVGFSLKHYSDKESVLFGSSVISEYSGINSSIITNGNV